MIAWHIATSMQFRTSSSSRASLLTLALLSTLVLFLLIHQFQPLKNATTITLPHLSEHNIVDSGEGGPRVRQVTAALYDNYTHVFERAVQTHMRHGEMWGYPTHVLRHSLLDGHSQFNKIAYLSLIMLGEMSKPVEQRAGWLLWATLPVALLYTSLDTDYFCSWFDIDTVIINPSIPWTLLLPPAAYPDVHFIANRDWNGFNSGVFFVRVHEWSVKMLNLALALPLLEPGEYLGFADQSAMLEIFSRPDFQNNVVYQPIRWYNEFQLSEHHEIKNYTDIPKGDMLLHFAGMAGEKLELMGVWLDMVEIKPDKWALPLEKTSYVQNVTEYWENYSKGGRAIEKVNEEMNWGLEDQEKVFAVENARSRLRETLWRFTDSYDRIQEGITALGDALSKALT